MKMNHLHLMVADVPAASTEVAPPVRERAYSIYVNAPGGFQVEVGA
jgi:hypothetical protein